MTAYKIERGDPEKLDRIQHLWEKLNKLHEAKSPDFKERFQKMNWERRKTNLLKKAGKIMFEYVVKNDNKELIGYCITTIEKEDKKTGEIDSIYVEEEFRQYGIGKQLINNAVEWLLQEKTETQKLLVGAGNETVIDFYRNFDFYPLHIVLQRKPIRE